MEIEKGVRKMKGWKIFFVCLMSLFFVVDLGVDSLEAEKFAVVCLNGEVFEREEELDVLEEGVEARGEESGLEALLADKEKLSRVVFAVGIFWFTGNYVKWMKKAFGVKETKK